MELYCICPMIERTYERPDGTRSTVVRKPLIAELRDTGRPEVEEAEMTDRDGERVKTERLVSAPPPFDYSARYFGNMAVCKVSGENLTPLVAHTDVDVLPTARVQEALAGRGFELSEDEISSMRTTHGR